MKVLCIIPSGLVFGLQIATLHLFGRLSPEIESYFLVTRWTTGEFAQRLEKLGIPYSYSWLGMFSRKLDRANLYMTAHCLARLPTLYRDVSRLVKTCRPDLIYTANYHELILLWPMLRILDIPVVCHMHNILIPSPFQRFTFFCWSQAVGRYVAVSDSVKTSIMNFGADPNMVSVLHNGIDLVSYPLIEKRSSCFSIRFGWPEESIIVGMTGQMIDKKGHKDFLQAARIVCRGKPDVRLVIGGRREGAYFERLQRLVADYGLSDVVAFSGWQTDMASFYSGLDVFVSPSHQDGFGLVIGEAMATGLPVVATRSGGASEVVEDGKTGILVERQSPSQLAEAILCLVRSPSLRRSMGIAGRQRVASHFDLTVQAQRFEAILRTAAGSSSG